VSDDEPKTLGEFLSILTPRGIYDVALIEDRMGRFGFTYNRATDKLSYGKGSVRLHAGTRDQIARDLEADPKGGVLNDDLTPGHRLIDANALTAAIHKLLFPGVPVPSDSKYDRGQGFKADVAAIVAAERPN
jgi:hypothetical protein